ncbi:MAG: pasI [Gammaproteobacteria bacterium]|jgi:putative ubiquitin-RnfH superfamily antitoxin RatB of RatAB toxin-antitoxin module|nr:pasI [Gammaproteobacteria bacterium]
MVAKKKIKVEIAYATPEEQKIIVIQIDEGCNIAQAIEVSGILQLFTTIDLKHQKIGIFSKKKKLSDLLEDGDRVEIYRPLIMDPKEARRKREQSRDSRGTPTSKGS